MERLFDSKGRHIATLVERRLYSRTGNHIGHYLPQYGVFVDLQGQYLGERVYSDRLMRNRLSLHLRTNFGMRERYTGRVGMSGKPETRPPLGEVRGFEDIDLSRLRARQRS